MQAGTHTHLLLVETLDSLTTTLLIPLPLALDRIYRPYAPRLSRFAMWIGTALLVGITLLHFSFVFEILWYVDVAGYYFAAFPIFPIWLLMLARLAYLSHKPAHGVLLHLLGATIVGFPVWAIWLGSLLASGKLTDASEVSASNPQVTSSVSL
jgi:hypothetical protein